MNDSLRTLVLRRWWAQRQQIVKNWIVMLQKVGVKNTVFINTSSIIKNELSFPFINQFNYNCLNKCISKVPTIYALHHIGNNMYHVKTFSETKILSWRAVGFIKNQLIRRGRSDWMFYNLTVSQANILFRSHFKCLFSIQHFFKIIRQSSHTIIDRRNILKTSDDIQLVHIGMHVPYECFVKKITSFSYWKPYKHYKLTHFVFNNGKIIQQQSIVWNILL